MIMMKSFGDWENGIREYCGLRGIDFDALNSMRKRWGIDFVEIVDDSGAVVLTVCRGLNGRPVVEENENTKKLFTSSGMCV